MTKKDDKIAENIICNLFTDILNSKEQQSDQAQAIVELLQLNPQMQSIQTVNQILAKIAESKFAALMQQSKTNTKNKDKNLITPKQKKLKAAQLKKQQAQKELLKGTIPVSQEFTIVPQENDKQSKSQDSTRLQKILMEYISQYTPLERIQYLLNHTKIDDPGIIQHIEALLRAEDHKDLQKLMEAINEFQQRTRPHDTDNNISNLQEAVHSLGLIVSTNDSMSNDMSSLIQRIGYSADNDVFIEGQIMRMISDDPASGERMMQEFDNEQQKTEKLIIEKKTLLADISNTNPQNYNYKTQIQAEIEKHENIKLKRSEMYDKAKQHLHKIKELEKQKQDELKNQQIPQLQIILQESKDTNTTKNYYQELYKEQNQTTHYDKSNKSMNIC